MKTIKLTRKQQKVFAILQSYKEKPVKASSIQAKVYDTTNTKYIKHALHKLKELGLAEQVYYDMWRWTGKYID